MFQKLERFIHMKSKEFNRLFNQINAIGRDKLEGYSLDMLENIPDIERKEAEELIVNAFVHGDSLITVLIPHLIFFDGKELLNSELKKCNIPSERSVEICFALTERFYSDDIQDIILQNYASDKWIRMEIPEKLYDLEPSYNLFCLFEKLYKLSLNDDERISIVDGLLYCCGILKNPHNINDVMSVSNLSKDIVFSKPIERINYLKETYFTKKTLLFQDSFTINKNIQKNILCGKKIPHSTSYPVIYEEEGIYYLAVFVFFFTQDDIRLGFVNRPTMWALADIRSGDLIKRFNTSEKEFSDARYDAKYDIKTEKFYDTSTQYYNNAFLILDTVRRQIIDNHNFERDVYDIYLRKILANIPSPYQRFYNDLSI